MKKKFFLAMFMAMFCMLTVHADDFVRVDGKKLIGRDGQSLVMRGTNCGNWMVREPYMMNTEGRLDRQFKFDKMIADICGQDKVAEFDQIWMDNNFNEQDMKFLAEQGFNTLRVPMHYKYFTLPVDKEPVYGAQTWVQEGFDRIDKMCEWAEQYNILLILDMHACPGGQSSGDICDYDESKSSLWEYSNNRSKLVALWRKIADRYKDKKCIAAYDLINETNWTLPNNNKLLWDTFKDIIAAIRQVDDNHIVIVEGNTYSNDYTGFPTTKMDDKLIIQYHRYGVYNTKGQVQGMADMSTRYNCPIFIGEFGENSNSWTADCVRLYEEAMQFAAWTCWPMKKSNFNALLQVNRIAAYDNVISQYQNGGKPDATTLWNALVAWAEAQNINNCVVRKDYIDALVRRPYSNDCVPYEDYQTGDYVYAAHYDMGPMGRAYWDTNDASYQYNGESFTNWQTGWVFRNDGVDLYGDVNDTKSCGYYVGETKDGEWIQYTIQNPHEAAKWSLDLRYAINSGTSTIRVTVNDRPVTPSVVLSSTGGWTSWATKSFTGIVLPQGTLRIRIYLEKAGLNLNWFRLHSMTSATQEELAVLQPDTNPQRNLLKNSECEFQGGWLTAALQSINDAKFTWNSTTNKPSQGTGNCLTISNARSHSLNSIIYQPVYVHEGHEYSADVAVRGASGNGDLWIQAYMTDVEPRDYDDPLQEANTLGQLNSWADNTVTNYDGMMSAKAKAGNNHKDGVMKWKATQTGIMYFALKVGTQKNQFSYSFDSFSFIDLTATAGIEAPQSDDAFYSLEGGVLTLAPGTRVYNLNGVPQSATSLQPGIYVVTNGKQSAKVVIK